RASAMHHSTTCLCSSWESVGLSPVVPTGTSPLVPSSICQTTRARNACSSTCPFRKGVTSAVNDPRTLVVLPIVALRRSSRPRVRVALITISPVGLKPRGPFLPSPASWEGRKGRPRSVIVRRLDKRRANRNPVNSVQGKGGESKKSKLAGNLRRHEVFYY